MICSKSDSSVIEKCVKFLQEEKVLILPTDTVYGFSGIIGKTDSLIRKIKGRAENKPFIVLISQAEDLKEITDDCIPEKLMKFWPGPLTVIVNDKKNPGNTVAVRCPGDQWLRKVIKLCGSPIYSTSVNRSGSPVLGKLEEIRKEFEEEVSMIVENGDAKSSVPSTIVKIEGDTYSIVRKGAVEL
ncbi:MAG: threonylcarbamoyl-AMP synthase [Treponema sp.]|nr:threonylcarbamoyl-AMP synthase [Treponema sp.]